MVRREGGEGGEGGRYLGYNLCSEMSLTLQAFSRGLWCTKRSRRSRRMCGEAFIHTSSNDNTKL